MNPSLNLNLVQREKSLGRPQNTTFLHYQKKYSWEPSEIDPSSFSQSKIPGGHSELDFLWISKRKSFWRLLMAFQRFMFLKLKTNWTLWKPQRLYFFKIKQSRILKESLESSLRNEAKLNSEDSSEFPFFEKTWDIEFWRPPGTLLKISF